MICLKILTYVRTSFHISELINAFTSSSEVLSSLKCSFGDYIYISGILFLKIKFFEITSMTSFWLLYFPLLGSFYCCFFQVEAIY